MTTRPQLPFLTAFGLAAILSYIPAQAQTLTFEHALQAALNTHPAIMGKQSSSAAARAEQEGAEWQRYPTPSVQAVTQNNGGTSTVVRVQQPLWTGGRITAGIEAASKRSEAAEAAVNETRLDIALKVAAAFIEAQHQQTRQTAAIAGVNEHEKLLIMISRRVEREVSPPVDKGLAQSRLFLAANDLSSITQARSNALAQLSQLTGLTVTDVVGEVADQGVPDNRERTLELATSFSPTLKRLSFEEAAAQKDVDLKRSAYMPQLSLRLERINGTDYTMSQIGGSRALLVVDAQPGAGLSAAAGVSSAVAKRQALAQTREAARRDLYERVTMDWNELVASRLRLGNAQQARTMSSEVFESYARQYTAGRKTWIDVLNAVKEATQSELAAADSAAQMAGAVLRLRLLTGSLDISGSK